LRPRWQPPSTTVERHGHLAQRVTASQRLPSDVCCWQVFFTSRRRVPRRLKSGPQCRAQRTKDMSSLSGSTSSRVTVQLYSTSCVMRGCCSASVHPSAMRWIGPTGQKNEGQLAQVWQVHEQVPRAAMCCSCRVASRGQMPCQQRQPPQLQTVAAQEPQQAAGLTSQISSSTTCTAAAPNRLASWAS
jgi:hypothetical protein